MHMMIMPIHEKRSDHIWDFFQHRDRAEDFRGFQADLACREDQGFQEVVLEVSQGACREDFRVPREVHREEFKRRRRHRLNSYRKCRSAPLPSIRAGSDAACSATPMFG